MLAWLPHPRGSGPWGHGEMLATQHPGEGSLGVHHGGPAFVPPYRGALTLPECHHCSGREALCPHLRKSPRCHVAGLEAVRRRVCTRVQGAEPPRSSLLLWEQLRRSEESLQQKKRPPTLTLCMATPPPPSNTLMLFFS